MESLYRRYRPQTFEDVVGQGPIVSTLKRAVSEGHVSQAYLFCGPRGTGKTTMARLLAKSLLCERGPGKLPDGTCEECRLVAAGEHPDVYELDAASRTGVDNVREEIISRVDYAPVRGRYKVYIIDEVHMLTPPAFNALLKTLEEPPEHVVFIMCTTDPQKIIATILSRVQRFDFRPIGAKEMGAHLAEICEKEGFSYEDEALALVVRHAHGGMRDAISTLEQLSVFGDGAVTQAAARDLLGEVSDARVAAASAALAKRDVATLFSEVAALTNAGCDPLQFVRELMAHVRDVYVVSMTGVKPGVLDVTPDEEERLTEEVSAYGGSDRLARVLTVLDECAMEMRTSVNQRLTLEVALTRAARPECDLTLESLAERLEAIEASISSGKEAHLTMAPQPKVSSSESSARQPASTPTSESSARQPASAPTSEPSARQPASAPTSEPSARQSVSAPTSEPPDVAASVSKRTAASPAQPPRTDGNLQRTWREMVDNLLKTNPSCGSLLLSASAESDDGTTLTVSLPAKSAFTQRMLGRKDVKAIVDGAVAAAFGPRALRYTEAGLVPPPAPTPVPAASASPTPAPCDDTVSDTTLTQGIDTPAPPTPASPTPASPTPASPTPASPTPASPTPASPTPASPTSASCDEAPYDPASMVSDVFGTTKVSVVEEGEASAGADV